VKSIVTYSIQTLQQAVCLKQMLLGRVLLNSGALFLDFFRAFFGHFLGTFWALLTTFKNNALLMDFR
jgi:hypothetical protein